MDTKQLMRKLEAEKQEIKEKIEELMQRAEKVDSVLHEIRKAVGRGGKAVRKKPGRKKGKKAPARPAKTAKKKKKKVTVRQAILRAVSGAAEPLAPAEIIKSAMKLCDGAVASIRSQISTLAKEGAIEKVEHPGRGFLYKAAASEKPAPKKAEK